MSLSQNPNQITPRLPSWMTTTPQQPTIAVTTGLLPGQITNALILGAIGLGGLPISYTDLQWVNPLDPPYNAVGDGVTDDTAAVQAAFVAGQGKTIYIPPGKTFLMSASALIQTSGTRVLFAKGGVLKMGASWTLNATVNPQTHGGLIEIVGTNLTDYRVVSDVEITGGTIDTTAYAGTLANPSGFGVHQIVCGVQRLNIHHMTFLSGQYSGGIMLEGILPANSSATTYSLYGINITDIQTTNGSYAVGMYFYGYNTSGSNKFDSVVVERIQDQITLAITDDRVLFSLQGLNQPTVASSLIVSGCIVRDCSLAIDNAVVSGLVNGVKYDTGPGCTLNDLLVDGLDFKGSSAATVTGIGVGPGNYKGTGCPVIALIEGTGGSGGAPFYSIVNNVTVKNITSSYAGCCRLGIYPSSLGKLIIDNITHTNCLDLDAQIRLITYKASPDNQDLISIKNITGSTSVTAQGNGLPAVIGYMPFGAGFGFNGTWEIENVASVGFQSLMVANQQESNVGGPFAFQYGTGYVSKCKSNYAANFVIPGIGSGGAPTWKMFNNPGFNPVLGQLGGINGNVVPATTVAVQNQLNIDVLQNIFNGAGANMVVAVSRDNATYYSFPTLGISSNGFYMVPAGAWLKLTYTSTGSQMISEGL